MRKGVLMYILGVSLINGNNSAVSRSSNNSDKVNAPHVCLNLLKNEKDKVAFGAMDPITATILQEAAEAAAKSVFGLYQLRKVFEKAYGLFEKYDVKPAIETALAMDGKYGTSLKSIFVSPEELLEKAIYHVGKLSDEHLVNRDLKQRVLDYCFLDKDDVYYNQSNPIQELFKSLDNKYYAEFKKYLLTKYVSQGKFELINDSLFTEISDKSLVAELQSKVKQNIQAYNDAGDSGYDVDIHERFNRV